MYRLLAILFGITLLIPLSGQELKSFSDIYSADKPVDGIDEGFIEYAFNNVVFPSQLNGIPTVTVFIGIIEISPEGEPVAVASLNACSSYFITEFKRLVKNYRGNWKNNYGVNILQMIVIEYRNVGEEIYTTNYLHKPSFIPDAIVCFSSIPAGDLPNDLGYLRAYHDYYKLGDYRSAIENVNILLERQPFRELFYLQKIKILTAQGENGEVANEEVKSELLFSNLE